VHGEERKGREILHERRMLRVDAEVGVTPGHVAGVGVVGFVPSEGCGSGEKDEVDEEAEDEESCDGRDEVAAGILRRWSHLAWPRKLPWMR
jgi:hypothetical protein